MVVMVMVVVVTVLLTVLLLLVVIYLQDPPLRQPIQEIEFDIEDLNNTELILLQTEHSRYHLYKTQQYLKALEHSTVFDANEYFVCSVQENNKHQYTESLLVHGQLPKAPIKYSTEETIHSTSR